MYKNCIELFSFVEKIVIFFCDRNTLLNDHMQCRYDKTVLTYWLLSTHTTVLDTPDLLLSFWDWPVGESTRLYLRNISRDR